MKSFPDYNFAPYWYFARFARDSALKDFVSSLARLPLAYQPGEVFEYGLSIDVLGRLIEVASRQPLDQFLGNRLFKPLGMVDTAFWVPPEKFARLVDPPTDAPIHPDRDVTKPTTLFSGGGGLVSTVVDHLRLCQMLLNGGDLDGVRILTPGNRPRRMTTNSLSPDIRIAHQRGSRSRAPRSSRPVAPRRCYCCLEQGAWIGRQLQLRPVLGSISRSDLRRLPGSRPRHTGIRRMTMENRVWGQRRIQAELARLGFKVSARTIAKYMHPIHRRGPSSRWRSFLRQHGHLGVRLLLCPDHNV